MEMGYAKGPGGDENLTLCLPAGQSAGEMWFESNSNLKGFFFLSASYGMPINYKQARD